MEGKVCQLMSCASPPTQVRKWCQSSFEVTDHSRSHGLHLTSTQASSNQLLIRIVKTRDSNVIASAVQLPLCLPWAVCGMSAVQHMIHTYLSVLTCPF